MRIWVARTSRTLWGPEPGAHDGDMAFVPLSSGRASSGLEAFLLTPGAELASDGRVEHGGTEALFIVEGAVDVQFADRIVQLSKGDFMQFPGHLSHQLRRTRKRTLALVVVSQER